MKPIRILLAAAILLAAGCAADETDGIVYTGETVVVYTAVDQPYAAPIFREFERRTGIRVIERTDAEAAKTVGLAERIRAERENPQADVWWGNEIFYTIGLAEEGLFQPYASPAAADIPELFKDPDGLWAGAAMRARVLGWFEGLENPVREPDPAGMRLSAGLAALTHPAVRGRVAMARPTAGTTGGHVAALYVLWGEERADAFFQSLRANDIKVLGGNAIVADLTGQGTIWIGLTDNDDVTASLREGGRLRQVLPDQETYGTLVIPCTVAMIQGARNPDPARQLIDYLLSEEVERMLIDAGFAGFSVRHAEGEHGIRPMQIDYAEAARIMPQAIRRSLSILEGR